MRVILEDLIRKKDVVKVVQSESKKQGLSRKDLDYQKEIW